MQIGDKELDKLYESVYVPVLKRCNLDPKRVDKHNEGGLLKSEIIKYIRNSIIILADLTNQRPNCYLEVGYAMGLDKNTNLILTAREDHYPDNPKYKKDGPKVHFDLSGYDIVFWNPENFEDFEINLEKKIRHRLSIIELNKVEEALEERYFANGWLTGKLPDLEGFCWLTLGVILPVKEEPQRATFSVSEIDQLQQAMETHKINGQGVWTTWYCPFPVSLDFQERLSQKMRPRFEICSVQCYSTEGCVNFYPEPIDYKTGSSISQKPDPTKGEWYDVWFDASGYMLASIGLPWFEMDTPGHETISAEDIYGAFFAMASLFDQNDVKHCFPSVLWDAGKFKMFAGMRQFPGEVTLPRLAINYPRRFPARGSSWSGPHDCEYFSSLDPKSLALHFTSRFLRQYGFRIEEEQLKSMLIIK
jgi:hypothetical protein